MRKRIRKILVTGGAGFIGSEFVRQGVKKGYSIIVVDKLTYAGDTARLKSVWGNITFYKTDICERKKIHAIFKKELPETVIHFAAETHVDRSIQNAQPFIKTNVEGTQNLIDLAREFKVKKFIHISTDEIYGESRTGYFKENDPLGAKNPYSSTKAAGELLIKAAIHTFQFPAIIIRPANNYGPWQYPEKLIPVIVVKAGNNIKVPVYGKGEQVREWLHVSDCASAVDAILRKGKAGDIYNIGSYYEQENIKTVKMILDQLKKPHTLIEFVKDRPGHDFRYSVDCAKLHKLGWKAKIDFSIGLKETIVWYTEHPSWLKHKLAFLKKYWQKVYAKK
ncbi:MAG: dTDP-glucose 4,6-dehydratase [Candidatus Omnitrophica bacterium]|nr:dTDP-glucose 4,6-dehydratase [Candidatus Omnitrophota bacterium]